MAKKNITKPKQNTPVKKTAQKSIYYKIIPVILIAAFAVFIIFSEFIKKDKEDPEYMFRKDGVLTFSDSLNNVKSKADIQIAESEFDEELGLMYRKEMDENRGMLFVFDEPRIQSFWMRNTFIPLDMIFVDSSEAIVNIAKNTKTLSDQTYSSTAPAQYVIEVNAGYCDRHNIKPGDKVSWVRTRPVAGE